jgi:hypothetical protein
MPDDHSHETGGFESRHDADPIDVSEAELDGVLEHASSKADDLTLQVGTPDNESTSLQRGTQVDQAEELAADIDRQLNEIDGLLSSTRYELGVPPPPADHVSSGPSAAAARSAEPIPDFMQEFTQPDPAESLPRQATPHRGGAEGGADTPHYLAEFTDPDPRPAGPAPAEPRRPEPSGHTVPQSSTTERASAGPSPGLASKVRRGGTRTAAGLCNCGVTVLEAIDRPVAGLRRSQKRIIGWIGWITLLAALLVYWLTVL